MKVFLFSLFTVLPLGVAFVVIGGLFSLNEINVLGLAIIGLSLIIAAIAGVLEKPTRRYLI